MFTIERKPTLNLDSDRPNGHLVAGYFANMAVVREFLSGTDSFMDKSGTNMINWLEDILKLGNAVPSTPLRHRLFEHKYNFANHLNRWLLAKPGYPQSVVGTRLEGLQVALTQITHLQVQVAGGEDVRETYGDVVEVPELEVGGWYLFFMGRPKYTAALKRKTARDGLKEDRDDLFEALRTLGLNTSSPISLQWACMGDPWESNMSITWLRFGDNWVVPRGIKVLEDIEDIEDFFKKARGKE